MSLFDPLWIRLEAAQQQGDFPVLMARCFAKMTNYWLYIVLLPILYFAIKGNSPSKALLGIKAIRLDGKLLGFWFNVWRNICLVLCIIVPAILISIITNLKIALTVFPFILLLYVSWALLYNKGIFIHDKLTKTRVVRSSAGNV